MTIIMPITTVSNTAALDLIDTCRALGVIDNEALVSLAINYASLRDPSVRFSESKLIELWHWIDQNTKLPHIGLKIGEQINPAAKGLLASWISQAESLGEALTIFRKNISLMNPSESWDLKQENNLCALTFQFSKNKDYPTIAIERSMSAMVEWGRLLSANKFSIQAAKFTFPTPKDQSHFRVIFGSNITFLASENSLSFDNKNLKLPITNSNQYLKSLVEEKAKTTLEALTRNQNTTTKTKAAIEKILHTKHSITIDAVCKELAMSRQTLYRKLKEEDLDYKTLSDEYKKTEAIKRLQMGSENIANISLGLGYKDTSSFYKAFKRWFGVSPSAYRENNKR
jgi:AraC-like DNA-binding protein